MIEEKFLFENPGVLISWWSAFNVHTKWKKITAYIINFMPEISRWIIFYDASAVVLCFCQKWTTTKKNMTKIHPKILIYISALFLAFRLFPVTSGEKILERVDEAISCLLSHFVCWEFHKKVESDINCTA